MTEAIKHIEWIDGAKGVAILSVILLHSLPCLREIGWMFHIGQAVPIFIFITAYLVSRHFESIQNYFKWDRVFRMLKKIFVPFLIVLFIQLVCLALSDQLPSLKTIIKSGGIGPGSYYVWLYMQTWAIIPFIVLMVRRVPMSVSMSIMLLIAIGAEYIFVFLQKIEHIDALYRLLPIRYLIVIYLGCLWPLVESRQKYILFALACVSGLLMFVDLYVVDNVLHANALWGGVNIVSSYWGGYHWYTAFYVILPIMFLEKLKYTDALKQAGKYSWYIFLLQMMCFGF